MDDLELIINDFNKNVNSNNLPLEQLLAIRELENQELKRRVSELDSYIRTLCMKLKNVEEERDDLRYKLKEK